MKDKNKKNQLIDILFLTIMFLFLTGLLSFAGLKVSKIKTKINKNNMQYYLHTDQSVKYAVQTKEEQIVNYYEYFKETKYWNTDGMIHKKYYVSADGYLKKMEERNENGQIIAHCVYFEKIKYGDHAGKCQFYFSLDDEGMINYATEFSQLTQKPIKYFEFYSESLYNKDYTKNIKLIYFVDDKGKIKYSIEREKNTKIKTNKIFYSENTEYDKKEFSHMNKIVRTENLINDNKLNEENSDSIMEVE